jgi:hypothetical protein
MKSFNLFLTRRIFLFFTFYICFLNLNIAQNTINNKLEKLPKTPKISILKGNITIVPSYNRFLLDTDSSKFRTTESNIYILPSFSYARMRAKGNFFQASITGFRYTKRDDLQENINLTSGAIVPARGAKTTAFNISTLVEWGISIAYNPERKSNFFVGWGVGEYFSRNTLKPYTSASFPTKNTEFNLNFSFVPSWQYTISEKCFIDIALPYAFATTQWEHRLYNNPALPGFARRSNNYDLIWTPKDIRLRIGLAVRI